MNTRLQWGRVEIEYENHKTEELDICSLYLSVEPTRKGTIYHFGKHNWSLEPAKIFLDWEVTFFSEDVLLIAAYAWVIKEFGGQEEKVKAYIQCSQPIVRFDKDNF